MKTTPSFILELGLKTKPDDEAVLNARFEAARQLYNACLSEAKRRLLLLRQSKAYQCSLGMPKTLNGKSNKERTEAFKELNAKFCFSEYVRKPHQRRSVLWTSMPTQLKSEILFQVVTLIPQPHRN